MLPTECRHGVALVWVELGESQWRWELGLGFVCEEVGASEGERGPSRRAYNLEAAGVLPGRGACCLAAACGEHGQEEIDKEASCCCASGSRGVGRGLWRGYRFGGARSARGEDAQFMPARCSMV
jgi:hypothetical protein